MNRDVLFKTENYVFSYRVAGVLRHNGRVLLTRDAGTQDGYAVPGGHAAFGETAEEALRREYREELRCGVRVGRFLALGEIFFPWGDRPCHQLCQYYEVELDGAADFPMEGVFHGWDDLGGVRADLDFCWVPLEQLDTATVYPPQIIPYLRGEAAPARFLYREQAH